jgi:hypothetical protein
MVLIWICFSDPDIITNYTERRMIVQLQKEVGSGHSLIVLSSDDYFGVRSHLEAVPIKGHKVFSIALADFGSAIDEAARNVITLLEKIEVRQATVIGVGNCGAVAISIALAERKRVRRLVLVDTPVRPQIKKIERIFSWIEARLPLGLPFRSQSEGFDARSYLQRIRCPTLVITTSEASSDIKSQALHESRALATAWFKEIAGPGIFIDILTEFIDIPAKRPQKNRSVRTHLTGSSTSAI